MAHKELNRRLTTLDASLLYFEKPKEPLHVGSCTIYEGHLSRDALMRILSDCLHLLPRYRQKVVFPPFGLAHPTWEDDPDFDIRNHVEELTLLSPADDRVLSEVGGRAFASPLDCNRPLWKLILLHGRPDGNTAMIWKVHHAMVDGISGVGLMMVMHDLKPNAEPPVPPATPWQPRSIPDPLTLLQDAVRDRLTETVQWWMDESFQLLRPAEVAERVRQRTTAVTSSMPALLQPAPRMAPPGASAPTHLKRCLPRTAGRPQPLNLVRQGPTTGAGHSWSRPARFVKSCREIGSIPWEESNRSRCRKP
jgi:hypothetical protein